MTVPSFCMASCSVNCCCSAPNIVVLFIWPFVSATANVLITTSSASIVLSTGMVVVVQNMFGRWLFQQSAANIISYEYGQNIREDDDDADCWPDHGCGGMEWRNNDGTLLLLSIVVVVVGICANADDDGGGC